FWSHVFNGDIMPCSPPEFVTAYQYESEQKRAFPELEYLVPRLTDGLDYINHAITLMSTCGVVNPKVALLGRDDAINARVVLGAIRIGRVVPVGNDRPGVRPRLDVERAELKHLRRVRAVESTAQAALRMDQYRVIDRPRHSRIADSHLRVPGHEVARLAEAPL